MSKDFQNETVRRHEKEETPLMFSVSENCSWLIRFGSLAQHTFGMCARSHTCTLLSEYQSASALLTNEKRKQTIKVNYGHMNPTTVNVLKQNKCLSCPTGEKKKQEVQLTQNSSLHGRQHISTKSHMTHCRFSGVAHDSVQHLETNIQDDAPKVKRWTQEKQVSAVIAYG